MFNGARPSKNEAPALPGAHLCYETKISKEIDKQRIKKNRIYGDKSANLSTPLVNFRARGS